MNEKSLQFELWQECNSLCKFCYLGVGNRTTPTELKIKSLQNALNTISNKEILKEYSTLSYLGGEFFQGQLSDPIVYNLFMNLMKKTAELLKSGEIDSVWLYATMTIGNQKDLYDVLKLFENNPKFWLLTSYDTIGRFHTEKMHDTWHNSMLNIHKMYPNYKINTTIILTGDLIDKYLNNKFDFKTFMEKYNTTLFFKQCGGDNSTEGKALANKNLPNFFPTRENFILFLTKFIRDCPYLYDKLFNIKYRADALYRNFNDCSKQMVLNIRYKDRNSETNIEEESASNKCGHLMSYAAYSDTDDCCICDKITIKELLI